MMPVLGVAAEVFDGGFGLGVGAADVDDEHVGLVVGPVSLELLLELREDVVGGGLGAARVGVDDAAGVALGVGDRDAGFASGVRIVHWRAVDMGVVCALAG